MTPLSSISGKVLGFSQGAISVGGYDINTSTGNRVSKNHTLAGRVPRGGSLKESMESEEMSVSEISVFLKEPDLTTSQNITTSINQKFGTDVAKAVDAAEVRITVLKTVRII